MRRFAVVSLSCWLALGVASAQDEAQPNEEVQPEPTEAPVPSEPTEPMIEEPIRFELDNGLTVVLRPVRGRRFASLAVTYRVGSSSVPEGWTGLAHLTEHLMFAGTDTLGEVEIYLRLEASGAVDRNGETGPDRSVYYELLPVAQLPWALYLESQRMARMLAGLTDERLERQRQVVLHEGWERGIYGWRGALTRTLYAGVFGEDHPYRWIVEQEDDVRAIELRHVQWFFQQYYAPDRATLSVVGGFDPVVLRREIERYFAPIRRSGTPPSDPRAPVVHPMDHQRRVDVEIQDDRDQIYVAWPAPALYEPGDAELDVLSTMLFERRDAPMRQALIESGLALDATVRQRSHELGSVFVVHAIPAPGHTTDQIRETIDRVLATVRAEPFGEEQVREAGALWARRTALGSQNLGTRAILLATGQNGYTPTIANEEARYRAVSAELVRATVERWLPRDRRLVLRAVANPRASADGRIVRDEWTVR